MQFLSLTIQMLYCIKCRVLDGQQIPNSLYSKKACQIILLIVKMKIVRFIVLASFYLPYYTALLIITILNLFKLIYTIFHQTSTQKPRISPFENVHKDVFATLYDFISYQDFTLEIYTLKTTDQVSLQMWRLYKQDNQIEKPFPILLMHGLLDCSVSWFLQADKSRCLPYMLAQQGYEVWLGNNRGNIISQKEQHPDQQFWDFNLDHLIEHDQPAIINGVLQISKKEKLIYVGHSQGSVQFVLSLGLHSQLPEKIAGFVGLGTVVSMANLEQHLLLRLLDRLKIIELIKWLGFKKLLVISRMIAKAVGILIYNCKLFHSFILSFVRMLCGYSSKNKISDNLFGVMMSHQPGGASSNNVLQWIQCFRHGKMRKFDYGTQKNQEIYGSSVPKTYCLQHLRKLPFDSYLFRGTKDAMMSKQNFDLLVQCFHPERVKWFQLQDYHHLEYIWSETADVDVFEKVVQIVHQLTS